jgi:PmbA protein
MSPRDSHDPASLEVLDDLLTRAKGAGADAADAVFVDSASIAHAQRLGAVEHLERSEEQDLGLRVFVGKRQACVSTSDLSKAALDDLVERALAMARNVPEDPYAGLAEPGQLATDWPSLDSCDPGEPDTQALIERARACEDAARSVAGITNSEGAEAGWRRARIALAATNGFRGGYAVSSHSVGCAVLAGEGTGMERDYAFHTAVYGEDLEDPAEVGTRAGHNTVRRLNPRRAKTGRYPVIFHPRVGNGLLRSLAGAISGPAVARGTSFLKDKMGEQVFAPGLNVIEDPHVHRGLKSAPFDAEGLPRKRNEVIRDGYLTTWFLSLSSARQLGLEPTGHASRGAASPPAPSPSNIWVEPGSQSADELFAGVEQGFYVTEMMGQGVNAVTGDYSRGAAGFWIEQGQIAYPVAEVTVAGNLKEMFRNITPASDLEFRYGIDAPHLRVDGMTVAGE